MTAVRDLFNLIDKADDRLLSELGRVLGLTAIKISELQQSARGMARADSRRRVWGQPEHPTIRLLYPCEAGAPLLKALDIGESALPTSTPSMGSVYKSKVLLLLDVTGYSVGA